VRTLGVGIICLGAAAVVAAFLPGMQDGSREYVLTVGGPVLGGVGAWLCQKPNAGARG
jgi:hypothetical protein